MIFTMSKLPPTGRRIYVDNAAATPIRAVVKEVMSPYLETNFGNPSAIHAEGVLARSAVESSRLKVARSLGIKTGGIVFTGSGTESNNLAILGYLEALHKSGKAYAEMEIVTTKIEHPSILALLPFLEQKGVKISFAPVNEFGTIETAPFVKLLSLQTVLVTFAYANSEVGVIQPVSRLARQVRQFEKEHNVEIMIHLDAAQVPLWLPCGPEQLGVDLLSLDAGKCCGPKGVGVLAMRKSFKLAPIMFGGGQEGGVRPGTENVMAIVGASEAISLATKNHEERADKVSELRDEIISIIGRELPDALINGPQAGDRLANNINLSLPGFDTEYAVIFLDSHGIASSTKSACAGAGSGMSHVVKELTGDEARARSTIRLSLGEDTTKEEMIYVVSVLVDYVAKMKPLTH
jgi:cysteine desulfurase